MTNSTSPREQFIRFLVTSAPVSLAPKFRLHTLPTLESYEGRRCRELYATSDVHKVKMLCKEIVNSPWFNWLEKNAQIEMSQLLGYFERFTTRNELPNLSPAENLSKTSVTPKSAPVLNHNAEQEQDSDVHLLEEEEDAYQQQEELNADLSDDTDQDDDLTVAAHLAPQTDHPEENVDNSPIVTEEAFRVWLTLRFSEEFAQRVVNTITTIDDAIDFALRYQYHGYEWKENKPNFYNISAYEISKKIAAVRKRTFRSYEYYRYSYAPYRTRSGDLRYWFDRYVNHYVDVDEEEVYDCHASLNLLEDFTLFAKSLSQRELDYYAEDNLDDLEYQYAAPYFEHEQPLDVTSLDLYDKKAYTYGVPKYFIYYGLKETNDISDWSKLFQAFCHRFYRLDPQAFSDCCEMQASSASPWIRRIDKKDKHFALSGKYYQMARPKNVGGVYAVDAGLPWRRLLDAMRELMEWHTIDIPFVIEFEPRDEQTELEKLETSLKRPLKKRVLKLSSGLELYRTTLKRLIIFHALKDLAIIPVSTRYDAGAVAHVKPRLWSRFVAATCSTLFQHMGAIISNANVKIKLESLITFNSDGYGGYPRVETTDLFVDVSKHSTREVALKFACDAIERLGLSQDEFIIDFQPEDASALPDDFFTLSEEEVRTYFPHLLALDQTQQDEEEDVEEEEQEDEQNSALAPLSDAEFGEDEEDEYQDEADTVDDASEDDAPVDLTVNAPEPSANDDFVDIKTSEDFTANTPPAEPVAPILTASLSIDAEPTSNDAAQFTLDIPDGQGILDSIPLDPTQNENNDAHYNPLLIGDDLDNRVHLAEIINTQVEEDKSAPNPDEHDIYSNTLNPNLLDINVPDYTFADEPEQDETSQYDPLAIHSSSDELLVEDNQLDQQDVTPDVNDLTQDDPELLTDAPTPRLTTADDFIIPNEPEEDLLVPTQSVIGTEDNSATEQEPNEETLIEEAPETFVEAPFNITRFAEWLRSHRRLLSHGRDRTIDQLRLFESRFLSKQDDFPTQTVLSGELHAITKTVKRCLQKDEHKRYVYKVVKSYHTELEKLLNFLNEEIARVDDPNYVPEQQEDADLAELDQQQELQDAQLNASLEEEEARPIVETPFDLARFTAWLQARRKRSARGRDKTVDQLRFFDSRFLRKRSDLPTQTVLSGELHAIAKTVKLCLVKDEHGRYLYRDVKSYQAELGKLLNFLNEEIARVDDPNYVPEPQQTQEELAVAQLAQQQELQNDQPDEPVAIDEVTETQDATEPEVANTPDASHVEAETTNNAQVEEQTTLTDATTQAPDVDAKPIPPIPFSLKDFRDYLQNDLRLGASGKSSVLMGLREIEKSKPFRKRSLPAKSILEGDLHAIAQTAQLLIQDQTFLKAVSIGSDLTKRYLTYLSDFCALVRAKAQARNEQNDADTPNSQENNQGTIEAPLVNASQDTEDSVSVASHDEVERHSKDAAHRDPAAINLIRRNILSSKNLSTHRGNDEDEKWNQTKAYYAHVLERAKERAPIPFSLDGFRGYLILFVQLKSNVRYCMNSLRDIEKSKPFRKRSLPSKKLREGDLYSIAQTALSLIEDATLPKELSPGYKDFKKTLIHLYTYCASELAAKEASQAQGDDLLQDSEDTQHEASESVVENAPQEVTDVNTQVDGTSDDVEAQVETNNEPDATPEPPTPQEVIDATPTYAQDAPTEAPQPEATATDDATAFTSADAFDAPFDRDDFMQWQTQTLQITLVKASFNRHRLDAISRIHLKSASDDAPGLLSGSLREILQTVDALLEQKTTADSDDKDQDVEKLNLLKQYVETKLANAGSEPAQEPTQTPVIAQVAQDEPQDETPSAQDVTEPKVEEMPTNDHSVPDEPENEPDPEDTQDDAEPTQAPTAARVTDAAPVANEPNVEENHAPTTAPLPSGHLTNFAHWLASSRGYPPAKINQVRATLSSVGKVLEMAEVASEHNLNATLDAGLIPEVQALVECVQNDAPLCAHLDTIDRRHAETLALYAKYLATLMPAQDEAPAAQAPEPTSPEEPTATAPEAPEASTPVEPTDTAAEEPTEAPEASTSEEPTDTAPEDPAEQPEASTPEEPTVSDPDATPTNLETQEDSNAQTELNESEPELFDRALLKWLQNSPGFANKLNDKQRAACIQLIQKLEQIADQANLTYRQIRTFDIAVSVQTMTELKELTIYQNNKNYDIVCRIVETFQAACVKLQNTPMSLPKPAPGNKFVDFNALTYKRDCKPVCVYLYGAKVVLTNWLDVYLAVIERIWRQTDLSAKAFYERYGAVVALIPWEPELNLKFNRPILDRAYLIQLKDLTILKALERTRDLMNETNTPYDRVIIEFTPPKATAATATTTATTPAPATTPAQPTAPSANAEQTSAPKPTETPKPAPGNKFVNFAYPDETTSSKPIRVILFGQESGVSNWKDVYCKVIEKVWRKSGDSATEFVTTWKALEFRPTSAKGELRSPAYVLDYQYLIETNLSAVKIVNRLRILLQGTETLDRQILIEFTPATQSTPTVPNPSAAAPPVRSYDPPRERTPQTQPQFDDADQTSPEPAPGTERVNFYGHINVTFCKPVRAVMFGKQVHVRNWRDVLYETINAIYRHSGQTPDQFAPRIQNAVNLAPVNTPNSFRQGMPILDGRYVVEIHYNGNDMLKKVQALLFATQTPVDNIVIDYQRTNAGADRSLTPRANAPRVTRNDEPTGRQRRQRGNQGHLDKATWVQWMTQVQNMKESTARVYSSELTRIANFAEANGLLSAELFSNDPERTRAFVNQIKTHPRFKAFNAEHHHVSSSALNCLLQYLESDADYTYTPTPTTQTLTPKDLSGEYSPEIPETPDGALRVNFKNVEIGNGTKPIQAYLFGYVYKMQYWKELYALAIDEIWKQTALDVDEYAKIVRCYTRLTAVDQQNHYTNPPLILDGEYYLDINYKAQAMLENLRDILDYFNLPFGKVAIDYSWWGTAPHRNASVQSSYSDLEEDDEPQYDVKPSVTDSGIPVEEFVSSQRRLDAVREIMRSHYSSRGLRVFGNVFEKFKSLYEQATGESITDNDAKLLLDKICVYNDDYYYYVSEEMRQELLKIVHDAFEYCDVVYFGLLFKRHFIHDETWSFLTQELMVNLIREGMPELRFEKNYMANDPWSNVQDMIEARLEILFMEKQYLRVEQLVTYLPYIPPLTLQTSCSNFKKVVADNKGTYVWLDVLVFDEEEVARTKRDIADWMRTHEAASVRHITAERTAELNGLSLLAAQNAIYLKYLSDEYDKTNGLICRHGAKITHEDLVAGFCEELEGTVELDVLEAYRDEMNIHKERFDTAIHDKLFKLNKKLFAPTWMVRFSPMDVRRADEILAAFVQDGVIALKDVTSFNSFPYVENLTWNRYSLGSYARRVSQAFKLLMPNQSTSRQDRGVIVPRSNTELEYDDAVAHILLRADVELTDEAVSEYLVEHGLRLRRGGSQEEMIQRVKRLKQQRDNDWE